MEGENIVFSLPGSVAPWKKEAALDETTQTDVEKVKVKEQRYVHVCVCVCVCGIQCGYLHNKCSNHVHNAMLEVQCDYFLMYMYMHVIFIVNTETTYVLSELAPEMENNPTCTSVH